MSDTGATQSPTQDHVEYFLDDIRYQGKSPRTQAAYERVLRDFEAYLSSRDLSLTEANHRDCMAYIHQLRGDLASSTVATYASYLHRFYDYMTRVDAFDDNPMSIVVEELDESINTDPARRDISVTAMRSFFESITHPLDRAVLLMLLKTGIRAGELCNLDVRDVSLSESPVASSHRPRLDGRPDSLYVDSAPAQNAVYNGERRSASNKRKRATTIPVDDELRRTLTEWLAVRPDPVSDANPLFVSTSDDWGRRLSPAMVHHLVETHAREYGWYREGGGPEENVTPHYFRHFFTTHLRDRTGDRGVVKYLRGDVAKDVIDTYTHDWGNRVREEYEANIYSLL
ncbi:Site-specific recombinase XerD [Halovenus aranensis]|jgi:site-specific recombinase XerD|uniref:Site-specific recombinase XerD n=1 Tax=Halovenus aranensis TaxID=890420 RepID=A0A1G8VHV2_9EURY|nr:tyrosine-type recombinase/integrase [Halovenus aranensis]SDJ64885.1 Site-specific recombinase XerD [Halovenus aranensis]